MKTQHLSIAAVTAVSVLILSACAPTGTDQSADEPLRISGVYENTQDAFWASFQCGAKDRAKELGIEFDATALPTSDTAKLTAAVDTALLDSPDGLIVNPIDPAAWVAKFETIMNTGVPVVSVQDFDVIPSEYSYVQADDDGGYYVDAVVDLVAGQSGTAMRLLGLADAPWQSQRLDPIVEGVKEANPGITWLDDQVDGFDVTKGTQIMTSVIAANPDLKLVLAPAGPEGQAIAAAIKQTGAEDITVVSFDAVPAEIEALRSGDISMLIAQAPYTNGGEQVQVLHDYLTSDSYTPGQPVPAQAGEPVVLPVKVLTPENVDDPDSLPYHYNGDCG